MTSLNAEGPGGRAAGAQQRDRPVAGGGQRPPTRARPSSRRPLAGSWRWPATRTTTRTCGPAAISQQEVDRLFGLGGQSGSGEPAVNWATQGAVRARLHVQGHLDRRRGRRRLPAARALRVPGLGEHRRPDVHQRRRPEHGRHVVRRGADPVLRHGVLQHRLPDVADRRQQGQQPAEPERANPEDAADGARLGLRQRHGRGPAGRVHRDDPDPPVAVQHVGGQRAQGPELVQERQRATARTCSRSSTTTARAAGYGSRARRRSRRSARAT